MKRIKSYRKASSHLLAFSLILLTFILGSCNSPFDLDEDPTIASRADVPYTSRQELELGVTGVYGQFTRTAWQTTFFVNGYSGDDMTTHRASNKADFREYDQRFITGENSRTNGNWGAIYRMVRAINNVFRNSADLTLEDQDLQDRLTGEMYFLRGLLFHHLTRIHGRIPIPLSDIPDPDIRLATQLEVYEQIESDYLMAESLLPTIYPDVPLGAPRPNSGSCRALLARLYLDWAGFPMKDNSMYAQAVASAKQVMDNSSSHGFALVDDIGSLWTLENRFNSESLFTIAMCNPCGLANRKYGKLGLPGDFGGWQETFAEIRFFEDFPEGPRKEATYHTEVPLDEDGKVTADVANASSFVPWTEFTDQQNPVFRKVVGPFEDNIFNFHLTDRNDPYMRYAELLLTYAEASGRAGSVTTEAWAALNMVRRRAAGVPISMPDPSVDLGPGDGSIEELAFMERKWELAGEYLRWNDLVRMERVEEALSNRNPRVSIGTQFDENGVATPVPITQPSNPIIGSLGTDNYFAPIPAREIEQNPNLADNN